MNLPFSLPVIKEVVVRKKEETAESAAYYKRKLAEYKESLENYKTCILEYSGKLDDYQKKYLDNQLSIVQTALDITYMKEQGDKTVELLEDIKSGPMKQTLSNLEELVKALLSTNDKLEGLDKNVVNRLSDLLLELQRQTLDQNKELQSELVTSMEELNQNVRKNHTMLWLIFILNFIGLNALIFMVLYIMKAMMLY